MSLVFKEYIPTAQFVWDNVKQLTLANFQAVPGYPNVLPLTLTPTLAWRKIWAFFFSSSAGFQAEADLVLWNKGQEVYRRQIVRWNTGSTPGNFLVNANSITANVGGVNNQILYTLNASAYGIAPHRLNVVADKAALNIKTIATGTAWDAFLAVESQQGV